MQTKKSPDVGQSDKIYPPFRSEAMNSRQRGGEYGNLESVPAEHSVVPDGSGFPRNTEGQKSKYPLQVSRKGERRY